LPSSGVPLLFCSPVRRSRRRPRLSLPCAFISGVAMARLKHASPLLALVGSVLAADKLAGTFKIIGDAGVGAMLTIQATPHTVFIVDKTEKNALQVSGHS